MLGIGSNNTVRWSNLMLAATDVAPASFDSVTAAVYDSSGVKVDGSDITLSAVAGSANSFIGSLPSTLSLTEGAKYFVRGVAVGRDAQGNQVKRTKQVQMIASYE